MLQPETLSQFENIKKRAGYLWRFLDVEQKQREIEAWEGQMGAPGFWDNHDRAQNHITKLNDAKRLISGVVAYYKKLADLEVMFELVGDTSESEREHYEAEITASVAAMAKEIETIELASFLTGRFDKNNAIFSIQAGAGGTESCDWADMLFRMYSRWAERSGFKLEIDDVQPGDQAGISKATIRIIGLNAYGFAKAERGVHRLVRISPFDSNARRHTSFAAVDVIAELDDDIEVDLADDDLRVDTYRSSGKGGQHTQKNDTAVRITHIPTGLVAACENERSQGKNRISAMKILKARVYEKMQDDKRAEMERFYGEKGEIGWGSQIRSYVFQPYRMVKDLRTGVDTSDVEGVMDGDIDRFITSWLRAGSPRHRNKDIKMED
ncbi:MAG TPA: peptide chain release factor 2 [Opitutaceae bacterium]|nr:peptide chain release factor 2 [Opitutaceae bacterium]